jgi:predicted enzyme related to lactoylglutathione lyase
MTANLGSSLESLAIGLKSEVPGANVEFTCFPSGGAMIDVRRSDQRAFVLAYSPSHGYAVDEVHVDDGFLNGYRFAYTDFNPAAEKLIELVGNSRAEERSVALNLVVIQARDLETTRQFYDCLGLALRREQHGRSPEHYAAQLGSTVFEVYPCNVGTPLGCIRIGFQVSSLEPTLSALRQQSAKILTEPHDSPWGRRAVVQDPDGNRVELTERR